MNKSKLFLYEIGGSSGTPKKSAPVFKPSFSAELFHSMWIHRTAEGVVFVGSKGADFPYKFVVQTEEEFVLAFLYVVYKDNATHGTFTQAARAGKFVYTHSMYERVRCWWARPDSVKYRGYRLDV